MQNRGGEPDLTDDEIAFCDALEVNDRTVEALADEMLAVLLGTSSPRCGLVAGRDWLHFRPLIS